MPTSAALAVYVPPSVVARCAHVVGADIPAVRRQRHDERQLAGLHPFGEQADLGVAEQQRRQRAIARSPSRRRPRTAAPSVAAGSRRHQRNAPTAGPIATFGGRSPNSAGDGAGDRADHDRPGAGDPAHHPTEGRGQGTAHEDPVGEGGDLTRTLPRPGHRLRARQHGGAGHRPNDEPLRRAPTPHQARTAERADCRGEPHRTRRRLGSLDHQSWTLQMTTAARRRGARSGTDLPSQGVEVSEHPRGEEVVVRTAEEGGPGVLDRLAAPQPTEQHTVMMPAVHESCSGATGQR